VELLEADVLGDAGAGTLGGASPEGWAAGADCVSTAAAVVDEAPLLGESVSALGRDHIANAAVATSTPSATRIAGVGGEEAFRRRPVAVVPSSTPGASTVESVPNADAARTGRVRWLESACDG
jgi:hypothetical protein